MNAINGRTGTATRPGLGLLAVALTVVLTVLSLAAATPPTAQAGPASSRTAHGELGQFTLVEQDFDITPAGEIVLELDLPGDTTMADLADTTLTVDVYGALASRDQVDAAAGGVSSRALDSISFPVAFLGATATSDLRVVVPTEVDTRTPAALQLPRPGLYPLSVSIQRDEVEVVGLTTFVHRLPADDETSERPLQVAVVLSSVEPVTLDGAAEVVVTDAALDELERLATALDGSPVPIAVRLAPALLDALAADDRHAELLDRLRAAFAGDDLLSGPLLPLDVSAAAAADRQTLYTQWLRDGEDALASVADAPPTRSVTVIDRPLSAAGGALVRDLGARLLVITPAAYADLDGPDAQSVGSALVDVSVSTTSRVPATVVDERVAALLDSGAEQPALTAVTIAAHLVAERQALADQGIDPSRRGVALSSRDLSLPNLTLFTRVVQLLGDTSGLELVHLDTLGLRSDVATDADGQPLAVGLPDTVAATISSRVTVMTSLTEQAVDTGSMLSAESARPQQWQKLIAVLPTEALTDDQVTAVAGDLFAEFAAIRGAVELPEGFPFTLTGRRSTVPVKIGNNGTEPLTVLVSLSSPKLFFPDGPQIVVLEPGQFTEVKVRIEARSNGDTPVSLEVRTPNGGARLGQAVPLKASVTAMSGLGNLVTGAFALVLIAWWLRHVGKNRRSRATSETAGRHPVSGIRPAGPADVHDSAALSPDAEASTLPEL